MTVADADSATITTVTAQITSNYSSGQDVLAMPLTAAISSGYDRDRHADLTRPGVAAAFQAALRTVTYRNTRATRARPRGR